MRDESEGECEESYSIIPVDTSFTFAQKSVCPQSSSFLSTDHMRKHDDSTHASAWLKVTLKRDICCTRVRSTFVKCLSAYGLRIARISPNLQIQNFCGKGKATNPHT